MSSKEQKERNPAYVEVGARIARARRDRGLEQKELAELIGVSEKTVSFHENGVFSQHKRIPAYAAALNVSEAWLWRGESSVPDSDNIVKVLEEQVRLLRGIQDEVSLIRSDLLRRERHLDGIPM